MHDTLKKPKDILTASYAVRYPEKALKSKTLVREVDVDPQVCQNASFHPMGFDDVAWSGYRIRQTKVARHRKVDFGDDMLQLYVENAFPVRYKAWEIFQRFVSCLLAACSCHLICLPLSLEAIDEIRVASHRRRLPDARTVNVPTSHRGVRMPLSRRSLDHL